jgi:uncharacterized protein
MKPATCEPRWIAIADHLMRLRFRCLAFAAVVGVLAYSISGEFVLERRMESMFRKDDPVLANYLQLRDKFGGNEIILIVFSDEEFWDPAREKLDELAQLHGALEKIEGVRGVMDLSVVDRLIQQAERPLSLFGGSKETIGIFSDSPFAKSMLDLFVGTTHAQNGPWLAVVCLLDPPKDATRSRSQLIAQIRTELQNKLPDKKPFLVGEPMMVEEGFNLIEADGRRLGWISSIVLATLMLVVYRDIRWTTLTLIVVHWSLIVTRAICVLAGWELTMVSSMLVAIVTVIGIATTMHWLFGYQRWLSQGKPPLEAIQNSLRLLIRPIAWACITDAIAFASLMAARVEPVRDYGLMMAVASLTTLVAIALIGPGFASLGLVKKDLTNDQTRSINKTVPQSPQRDRAQSQSWGEGWLDGSLRFFLLHQNLTLVFLVVWIAIVLFGSSRLIVETDFLHNFRESSSLVQGYSIVEKEMGGAGVWEVLLPAPASISNAYLDTVSNLEAELRQLASGNLTQVISLADADQAARRSIVLATLPIEARLAGMRAAMPSFFDSLITPKKERNLRTLRIMLRSSERMTVTQKLRLIGMVESCCQHTTQSPQWQEHFPIQQDQLRLHPPVVTGYYVLLSNLVQSVVADQWICFAIATAAILLALRVAIGSWKLSLIALVPNTLPALGAIAALGILGIKMNLGAAMIAAVSIGLSVDSSLHYLIEYQRGRNSGLSTRSALEQSQRSVGMPVVVSTVALVIGFASLAISEFIPTVVFGTLASITMAVGMVGNLWWLPVLINLVDRRD